MTFKVTASVFVFFLFFFVLYNDDWDSVDFIDDFRATTGYKTIGVGVLLVKLSAVPMLFCETKTFFRNFYLLRDKADLDFYST